VQKQKITLPFFGSLSPFFFFFFFFFFFLSFLSSSSFRFLFDK